MDNIETQYEVMSKAARKKMARIMKMKGKMIARKREISMKKKASPEKILKRAQKQARDMLAQKILKGKSKSSLSQSGKVALEKKLDKKKAVIKSLAKRLIPKVKQAETARLAKQKEE
jgi:hypothetical protein